MTSNSPNHGAHAPAASASDPEPSGRPTLKAGDFIDVRLDKDEPLWVHCKAHIVSESALVLEWEDGESDPSTHEWRPAATSFDELFLRGLERLAERQGLSAARTADLPLEAMAARAATGLTEVLRRAVRAAEAADSTVITADIAAAAFQQAAADFRRQ
ncbi:hypothetical protein ABPG75_000671 [Micractinium tetrahymenae]